MNLGTEIAAFVRAITAWWYWTLGVIAAAAIAAPMLAESTESDPSAGAGVSAPIVALCTAAIVFSEAMHAGELRIRRIPSIFVGIGGLGSAYLWIADAAKTHPANPELPLVLGIIFGLAAVATITVPLVVMSMGRNPNDRGSA